MGNILWTYVNQTSLKHKSYSLYDSELARIFESTNNIKIKITRHILMEDECIWEGISFMNACWVSQSVLNVVSDEVFKENV